MKWSANNNAFFYDDDVGFYLSAGWDLGDLIDVDDDLFDEFKCYPAGKCRGVSEEGMPIWVDAPSSPPPSKDELITQADVQKSALQREAEDSIKPLGRAKSLGISTPEELALLLEWEKYSVYLMRVDTSTAPDVAWPQKP